MSTSRGALALTLAALALGATGCGGSGSDAGKSAPHAGLSWAGTPSVFRARNNRNDRVVIAHVRNTGSTTLHIVAAAIRVRDASGRPLAATAAFNTTYAHGLYGALEQPKGGPPAAELLRLGKVVYLPPGATVPFYAAWRLVPGTREPVRVDYGSGSLAVPAAGGETAG